ncbi:MAG: S4 domain-containing protein, partial [Acholeplasmataceae bacterium]
MIQFKIKQDDLGKRLDLFLIENSQDVSRSQIQNQIKAGLILVNNANVKTGYLLKEDDKITWKKAESETTEIKAINLEIPIVYQDEYLAVINKPEGLVVHPASSYEGPTLVH